MLVKSCRIVSKLIITPFSNRLLFRASRMSRACYVESRDAARASRFVRSSNLKFAAYTISSTLRRENVSKGGIVRGMICSTRWKKVTATRVTAGTRKRQKRGESGERREKCAKVGGGRSPSIAHVDNPRRRDARAAFADVFVRREKDATIHGTLARSRQRNRRRPKVSGRVGHWGKVCVCVCVYVCICTRDEYSTRREDRERKRKNE